MKTDDKIATVETPIAADKPSKPEGSEIDLEGFSASGLNINLETRFNAADHKDSALQSSDLYSNLSNLPSILRSILKAAEENNLPIQQVRGEYI